MVGRKLILICQSGGEFIPGDDGSLVYKGGEANAVNVNHETAFDDLCTKLAEMYNLDQNSISIKYFVPGHSCSLINMSNDKDFKRMLSLYEDLVTANLYLSGKEGFNCNSVETDVCRRGSGIILAETVNTPLPSSAPDPVFQVAAGKDNEISADEDSENSSLSDSSSSSSEDSASDFPQNSFQSQNIIDITNTPADTVKKRRRTTVMKVVLDRVSPDTDRSKDISAKRRPPSKRKKESLILASDSSMGDDEDKEYEISRYNNNSSNLSPKDLVASWKKAIDVGKEFRNVYEFRDVLQKYAISHRFSYKLKKNEATRVCGKCAVEGCSWRIYASKLPSGESFCVRKMVRTHTCGDKKMTSTPSKNWVVGIIKERLQRTPESKPKDLAKEIARDFGVNVNYSQLRRGIMDVKSQVVGSHEQAYCELPQLCEKVGNVGNVELVTTEEDKRFQHLFLCLHASSLGFRNGCRPILFLDSTLLESKYHESMLVATSLDGNDGSFPVAIAIVDVENKDTWVWFLEKLKSALPNSQSLTIAYDREKLLNDFIVKVFEDARIGYSMYHLVEEFKKNLKGPFYGEGRNSLVGGLVVAAHASRLDEFKSTMDQIKQASPNSYDWLQTIEPRHWANALFVGERFNHIIENPVEPFIRLLDQVKDFPITHKIELLTKMITELINARRSELTGWPTDSLLTPKMEEALRSEILKALKMKVLISSEHLFEVRDKLTHVVNIGTRDCTCRFWKITGLPCSHAVAVFNHTGRNLYDYCSRYFSVGNFVATYNTELLDPFAKEGGKYLSSVDVNVLPPRINRPSSQDNPKQVKQRRPGKRVLCCSKCQGAGHNMKTCKASL